MEDINYRTEPLDESFSHEVTLAYPTFLRSARRSNSYVVEAEDIVQEALGEAWKYASINGMPKTRKEFVKWGIHIIGWKISDFYKQSRKLEKEISNSETFDSFFDLTESLSNNKHSSVINKVIYNELHKSFSDRVDIIYYSKNPVGAVIPHIIAGANMAELTSKLGYSSWLIRKTNETLDSIVSEIINT